MMWLRGLLVITLCCAGLSACASSFDEPNEESAAQGLDRSTPVSGDEPLSERNEAPDVAPLDLKTCLASCVGNDDPECTHCCRCLANGGKVNVCCY